MIEFQDKKTTLAIVLDKDGNTAGLITAEDIFEEILGEFDDEFDEDDSLQTVINKDGSITVNGRMEYEKFNEKHGNVIPIGQYETVAGYIISEIGRIPSKGEELFLPIGQILIRKSSARNILEIQLFPEGIWNLILLLKIRKIKKVLSLVKWLGYRIIRLK